MNDEERDAYFKRKVEEERLSREREKDEKRRREEETQRAMLKIKRLAEEEARGKAELERRIAFFKSVKTEHVELETNQAMTRSFVYSYFELKDALAEYLAKKQQKDPEVNELLGIKVTDSNGKQPKNKTSNKGHYSNY